MQRGNMKVDHQYVSLDPNSMADRQIDAGRNTDIVIQHTSSSGPLTHNQDVSSDPNSLAPYMDPELYRATKNGDINGFNWAIADRKLSVFNQVSPRSNSVLHIASSWGHQQLVELILTLGNDLFRKKNSSGNLAIHVAAAAGHLSIVKSLIDYAQKHPVPISTNMVQNVLKERNNIGNTALHVALLNHHEKVAILLEESFPEASCFPNDKRISPLYLAVEAGYSELVKHMVEITPAGLKAKSLVQAAIRGRNKAVLDTILEKESTLIDLKDEEGRTPLYYATSVGCLDGVRYLLDKSCANLYEQSKHGSYPIHIASSKGHLNIIQEFLWRRPDSIELLNKNRQNILHVAAKRGKDDVVNFILKTQEFEKLLNEKDVNGNTPLHLAARYGNPLIVCSLTLDDRVNVSSVNNDGLTALDATEEYGGTVSSVWRGFTIAALVSAGVSRAPHRSNTRASSKPPNMEAKNTDVVSKPPNMEAKNTDVVSKPTNMEAKKADVVSKPSNMEANVTEMVNTLLLVSTLVVTVTFAAGFTMPGGYNNSKPHLGMATLVNRPAFQLFVIFNTVALYSAIVAANTLIYAQLGDANLLYVAFQIACPLLAVALTMMSLAFIAGVGLVVSHHIWLVHFVWVIGSIFLANLVLLFFPLYFQCLRNRRLGLRLIYYQTYIITVASSLSASDDGMGKEEDEGEQAEPI